MTETLDPALPPDVDQLAHRVLRQACDRQLTIATAESCTGGLLASLLTDVDGCAHAFERGFVSYTEAAKQTMLGVGPALLASKGAVSAEAAEAMVRGALSQSEADVAAAVTGFAGRGAPGEEPGLVYVAVARRGGDVEVQEAHFGDVGRGAVRLGCLRMALQMLTKAVS